MAKDQTVQAFGNTFHNQGSCVTTPNQITVEEAVPNGASFSLYTYKDDHLPLISDSCWVNPEIAGIFTP
jgi:hypothetical protein